jgi:hypothetical protein
MLSRSTLEAEWLWVELIGVARVEAQRVREDRPERVVRGAAIVPGEDGLAAAIALDGRDEGRSAGVAERKSIPDAVPDRTPAELCDRQGDQGVVQPLGRRSVVDRSIEGRDGMHLGISDDPQHGYGRGRTRAADQESQRDTEGAHRRDYPPRVVR